ncbi:sodium/hydrogen exchanger 2-like [Gordionus sp. m RMFG-2023]|uniref:sodium/hydrogen exchanger 2-like n=1 Tax=Gordionus sp. m RMFG-2023 TaxID=3053472 RepID=UPI0031FCD28B
MLDIREYKNINTYIKEEEDSNSNSSRKFAKTLPMGNIFMEAYASEEKISLVRTPFIITIWILIANISRISFHISKKFPSWMPESCVLIITGIIYGSVFFFTKIATKDDYLWFTYIFFFVLLPPIALNAGYYLYGHKFFDNIWTILNLAVIGTLWNTLGIGLSLYGLVKLGVFSIEITIVDCLLFGSLISAVDPVSVLAIFEEIHVNEILYIIMFGESLLNDGICVVLYNLFLSFKTSSHVTLDYNDLLTGVSSFAFVAMGGIAVGLMVGIIASYVTKYTNKTPNIEPLFMLAMAYLSYLISDLFQISGIMAIISCAIVNQHYASHNLSMHSNNCVANLLAMLSSVCESMIFLWMGISIFGDYHLWNSYFIFFSLLFCFIFRASGIIVLVWIANQRRLIKLDNLEQFILSYSGLRGAISFSLALSLIKNEHLTEDLKRMFLTTTIIIVLFTTFFQGMTIKPLVDYLRIKKSEDNSKLLSAIVFGRFLKHLVNGMESIVSPQEFFLFKEKLQCETLTLIKLNRY